MIIKITQDWPINEEAFPDRVNRQWHIYDNLTNVTFTNELLCNSKDFLTKLKRDHKVWLIDDDEEAIELLSWFLLSDKELEIVRAPTLDFRYFSLTAYRKAQRIDLLFDGTAYICNDSGKTVDMVNPHNKGNVLEVR